MRYVDIGIPANNKGKHSIGVLFWILARMVLQMRGAINPGHKWDVMVMTMFIHFIVLAPMVFHSAYDGCAFFSSLIDDLMRTCAVCY